MRDEHLFLVIAMNTFLHRSILPFLLAAALFLQFFAAMPASAATAPPEVEAAAAVLMDAESGDLLYSLKADNPVYAAGLTVMMTALLAAEAVEAGEMQYEDKVAATEAVHTDISQDAAVQNIVPGEIMSLRDLMYCALIGAGSDACNVIGTYVGKGSLSRFVEKMNTRAKELGCKNTKFYNTHGLPHEGQQTSARDMAIIASAFVKHSELMNMVNTMSVEIPATEESGARHLNNTNYILRSDYTRYYYSYASGIKSSYTDEAGFCLASAMKTDDSYVVSVVMGCISKESESGFTDIQSFVQTRALFQWFSQNYGLREIVNPMAPVHEVPVEMGEGADSVVVCADGSLSLFLPNDLVIKDHYKQNIKIYSEQPGAEPLQAPVERGQVLGEMIVVDDSGKVYGPFKLVANTSINVSRLSLLKSKLEVTFSKPFWKYIIWGILGIIVIYIALVIRYNVIRARHRKKRRQQQKEEARSASER